jgi:hypothetical protein
MPTNRTSTARRRRLVRGTRAAVGMAALITPFATASFAAFADSTDDGYHDALQRICLGQNGIVVRTAEAVSCENVTPSPHRIHVLGVIDHVCEELLDHTFSSGPIIGPSDGSIITWTCSTGDMPVAVTDD